MLAVVLVGTVTAGCTAIAELKRDNPLAGDTPPPTLRPAWSVPGLDNNPEHVGENHWVTLPVRRNGVGWGTAYSPGALVMVDARTGETSTRPLPGDGWPCGRSENVSPSGLVVVMLAAQGNRNGSCSTVLALDASTGKTLWRRTGVDLTPVERPRKDRHVVIGADDDVVAIARVGGAAVCLDARDGKPVADDDQACRGLADRLTHADLPALTDPDGEPVPFAADGNSDTRELGRTDEVLLVETTVPDSGPRGATEVIRAHDLETGETLWEDTDLTLDPHGDPQAWNRRETYFVAPSGIARVSYDYVDAPTTDPDDETEESVDVEELATTPMVVTAVDPRTGELLHQVAQLEGAWFNHQFGDMTVALTEQQLLFRSTISGFELPRW